MSEPLSEQAAPARPWTAERLRAEIAELLYLDPGELDADENLIEAGLDSIRVMTLIERWKRDGVELSFADLAERPTVAAWAELLR